jgi:uncharacterized membrane protein YoaT (DUF817 family)/uncharacterized membrane protein YGL010W
VEAAPRSQAALWPVLGRFVVWERRLGRAAVARGRLAVWGYEFFRFGLKQGWACLFGALLLGLGIVTHIAYPAHAALARLDFLFLAALLIQAAMLGFRLESLAEARVILVFHATGMAMEIFKTAIGSWVYPEPCHLHIGGVPLFTGFMYAAIGSYLFRVWRLLEFRFFAHPPLPALGALAVAIYVNFFTNHDLPDMRLPLLAATVALFARTRVYFRPWRKWRSMPLLLGFFLVALFIWLAENIGTFTEIWRYPSQAAGWRLVPVQKLEAWFLLMLVSYTLVAFAQRRESFPIVSSPAVLVRSGQTQNGSVRMSTLTRDLTAYAAYHRDPRNVATHLVGIPLIVFAVEILLARPLLGLAGHGVSVAALASVAAALYYLWLDLILGLALTAFLALAASVAAVLAALPTALWLAVGVGAFGLGWVFQFVGHAYEGRKPAFFDDIRSLLTGPLFVAAELSVKLGLRPGLAAVLSGERP